MSIVAEIKKGADKLEAQTGRLPDYIYLSEKNLSRMACEFAARDSAESERRALTDIVSIPVPLRLYRLEYGDFYCFMMIRPSASDAVRFGYLCR